LTIGGGGSGATRRCVVYYSPRAFVFAPLKRILRIKAAKEKKPDSD